MRATTLPTRDDGCHGPWDWGLRAAAAEADDAPQPVRFSNVDQIIVKAAWPSRSATVSTRHDPGPEPVAGRRGRGGRQGRLPGDSSRGSARSRIPRRAARWPT